MKEVLRYFPRRTSSLAKRCSAHVFLHVCVWRRHTHLLQKILRPVKVLPEAGRGRSVWEAEEELEGGGTSPPS